MRSGSSVETAEKKWFSAKVWWVTMLLFQIHLQKFVNLSFFLGGSVVTVTVAASWDKTSLLYLEMNGSPAGLNNHYWCCPVWDIKPSRWKMMMNRPGGRKVCVCVSDSFSYGCICNQHLNCLKRIIEEDLSGLHWSLCQHWCWDYDSTGLQGWRLSKSIHTCTRMVLAP